MMYGQVLLRVVEQAGADAHLVVMAAEYVEVAAALAALPEFGVVGEFGERDGPEPELVVHLHHGGTGRYREYLGIGKELSREYEGLLLDSLCHAHAPEVVGHYKSRVRHETLASPGLDVRESGEASVVADGYHGLSGPYLVADVLRRPLGDSGLALQRRNEYFLADLFCVYGVAFLCHGDCYFHVDIQSPKRQDKPRLSIAIHGQVSDLDGECAMKVPKCGRVLRLLGSDGKKRIFPFRC